MEMDMLSIIAEKPARITRIIYGANANYTFARQHLRTLVKRGLLAEKTSRTKQGNLERRTYSLTQKGLEFVTKYQEIRRD